MQPTPDSLSIMVVEDNHDFRDLLCEMLTMLNHSVCSEANAESALQKIEEQPIDVLISDVGLPGMSGLELAKEVHARHPKMKIVLSSGYDTSVGAHLGFKVGVLCKPYSVKQLSAALQAME